MIMTSMIMITMFAFDEGEPILFGSGCHAICSYRSWRVN